MVKQSPNPARHPLDTTLFHFDPTDITTFDVSILKHGFCPKLPNDVTKFLNGLGAWSVPAGGINPHNSLQLTVGFGYVRYTECPIGATLQSVEANAQIRFPACTIKYLACKSLSNSLDSGGLDLVRLRKNGAYAGLNCPIPHAGDTNCRFLDIVCANGNLLDVCIDTTSSGSGSATIIIIVGTQ